MSSLGWNNRSPKTTFSRHAYRRVAKRWFPPCCGSVRERSFEKRVCLRYLYINNISLGATDAKEYTEEKTSSALCHEPSNWCYRRVTKSHTAVALQLQNNTAIVAGSIDPWTSFMEAEGSSTHCLTPAARLASDRAWTDDIILSKSAGAWFAPDNTQIECSTRHHTVVVILRAAAILL